MALAMQMRMRAPVAPACCRARAAAPRSLAAAARASPCSFASSSRARAVRVLAYRDVHREQKICGLGAEVVNAWFKGIKEGPDAARRCLLDDVDDAVAYRSSQVLRIHKGQGIDYLCKRIGVKHSQMELLSHRIIATAACSQDDTFFALVEYEYKSKVMDDPHVNTGYKIIEMDVMYDDTTLRVMGIHERNSLAPDDVSAIASVDSAHSVLDATPFPEASLTEYPGGLNNETVLAHSRAWCQARSSGQPEELLDKILDPSFRLWDAYGVLPVLCDPSRRAQPDACCVRYDSVKDIIRSTKAAYDIKCKLVDNAVSIDKNVAFTHWKSRVVNKATKQPFEIEALEVDLFSADGRLKEIFLFRDTMDAERATLEGKAM